MDDAVADGVCQDGITNLVLPAADAELRAEDSGGDLVPGLNDLQQVAGLRFLQAVEQPLVQNQQGGALVLLDDLREGAVAACNGQFREQLRKADIAHLHEVTDGGHAQGTGQVGLSRAGRAHEDDVVGFGDVRAGGQTRNHGLVQAAVRVILNVLHTRAGVGEMSRLFQPRQLVVLPGAPFPVHQKADTILKGHIVVDRILQLFLNTLIFQYFLCSSKYQIHSIMSEILTISKITWGV